jgi:hypothetical protein
MTPTALRNELRLLWRAHHRVGLTGKICLYSRPDGSVWPSKTPNIVHWFGPDEVEQAITLITTQYNNGVFPYTPLLLNPIVHQPNADGSFTPLGSGLFSANGLTISDISADKVVRLKTLNIATSYVTRGPDERAGLKLLAFANEALPITPTHTARGSREMYDLSDIDGEPYWWPYLFSGMAYLTNTGAYANAPLSAMFPELGEADASDETLDALLARHTIGTQTLLDAAHCWNEYDRHATLYTRFGNDVAGLPMNLKLYEFCARDFEFFDSIGPESVKEKAYDDGGFEFLVHGLIPRGAIVLLAGTGGTGKSSIAHQLCNLVSTDWKDDEQPMWLGQPVNKKLCKGVCIYFSGEDGPAIIGARNDIFDPEMRAKRLMFQRTDFRDDRGEEISFAQFLERLKKMPTVPLLVIDPARKYLTGDENDAGVVSEFFEAIERFSHERNTAVIVVHHLSKGAKPKSARDVVDELRGSQVFIDRPRVVIGMFREGPRTIVGLGKCNIPPSLGMVIDERVFAHNPQTLALTQLPGPEGVRSQYAPVADEE